MRRVAADDPDQSCSSPAANDGTMPLDFDPRRYSTIELVAIAAIVLSLVAIAYVLFLVWAG
jgi:hypothetical protein